VHSTPRETFSKTVVPREFSKATSENDTPYYPPRLESDLNTINLYQARAKTLKNRTLLGRLATYRYLDMDEVIDESLSQAKELITSL
jgi:UDP-galactopyranose mutase